MTFLFANIGYLYWTLGIIAVFLCYATKPNDAVGSSLTLFALILPSSMEVWGTPASMGIWHVVTIGWMCLFFYSKTGFILICLTFPMVLADAFYMFAPEQEMSSSFPLGHFWWHSILNILYTAQCIVIFKGCYTSHVNSKQTRSAGNDTFYARNTVESKGAVG